MNRTRLISALPLVIFVLLTLTLAAALLHSRENAGAKFAQHVGDLVPTTDLPILQGAGARFRTDAWQGKPYLVNFFASWCVDCRAEHEELMSLSALHLPMVGIVFKDRPDKAAAYLDYNGNPFAIVAQDDDGRAGIDWGLTGVPETFLVDGQGVIRWHHIGGLTDAIINDELIPALETLMHEERG